MTQQANPLLKLSDKKQHALLKRWEAQLQAERQTILDTIQAKITATGRRFVRTGPILSGAELGQQTYEPLNLTIATSSAVRLTMALEEAGRNDIDRQIFNAAFFAGVDAPRTVEEQDEFNKSRMAPEATICNGLPENVAEELMAELMADWKEKVSTGAVLPLPQPERNQ